jgi:hypothetical protein
MATSTGRNDGAGMCTPGGGDPSGAERAPGGIGVSAISLVATSAVDDDGSWSYSRRNSRPQ